MIKNKKGFEISFAIIFAIIAGIFILFLAIYLSSKIINIGQTEINAKTAKEIGILLNPLETGFETGKIASLSLPKETRIYNGCDNTGVFGKQKIEISQKNFKEWVSTDVNVVIKNKYIFSENYVEGKDFYLFSKPFKFPFKVSDVIYLTSKDKNYCFFDTPEKIKTELKTLEQKNIFLGTNCPNEIPSNKNIIVCFSGGNCNVNVEYENGKGVVKKDGSMMYFETDSLMYAGIFSDPDLYECQLKRLMQRTEQLSLLYKDKEDFVSRVGCSSNLNSELTILGRLSNDLKSNGNSNDLRLIGNIAEEIQNKNEISNCRLW